MPRGYREPLKAAPMWYGPPPATATPLELATHARYVVNDGERGGERHYLLFPRVAAGSTRPGFWPRDDAWADARGDGRRPGGWASAAPSHPKVRLLPVDRITKWLRRRWVTVVLLPSGVLAIIAALYQRQGRDGFAGLLAAGGFLLILAGAFSDRFRRGKLGPMEVELDQAAEHTLEFAESPDPPPADSIGPDEENDATRWALAEILIQQLLLRPAEPLQDCHFQLYLFDADARVLSPILDESHSGPRQHFVPGQGATGEAWETGNYVVADGPAVCDETFNLTTEQQELYRNLAVVAAMPVINAGGQVLAILSADSPDPASKLAAQEGFERHVFLAEAVARIFVDLFKWFDDTYDDQP